jgi:hypothetical protein
VDETISVEVGEDHLAAFRRSPKTAIAELIWNSLDADATQVSVDYELNSFDGVDAVTVRDNGTGMTPAAARFGFRNFGNSWKRTATSTPGGRIIHGKLGRGRYTAYAIGAHPVWISVADDDGVRRRLIVTGSGAALRSVRVNSEAEPVDDPVGTIVRIDQLTEQAQRELLHDTIWQELTTRFAPYLEQYPEVSVTFRGKRLRAAGLQDRAESEQIRLGDDVDLAGLPPVLREDGSDAIPDLVLSRTMETAENKYEHLVVELKRPSHMLKPDDIDQVRSYAVAVTGDDRFQQPNVQWTYVLVGNSTSTGVDDQRDQVGQPYGRVQIAKRYSIWVKNWAEIIGDARHRHKFVQHSLDYKTTHDTGVDYLRRKHREYLPDAILDS